MRKCKNNEIVMRRCKTNETVMRKCESNETGRMFRKKLSNYPGIYLKKSKSCNPDFPLQF
jgi:hypothetical protein